MDHAAALKESKATLRAEAKGRRAAAAEASAMAGENVAQRLLHAVPPPVGAPVSGYWPMADELDCRPLLTALHQRGHAIGLPVVAKRGEALRFRAWQPGDSLVDGGFGTSVPASDRAEVVPAYLLVPLLAFDRDGYRLGYGGGFYDRTLEALRRAKGVTPLAVGIAFAAQEVPSVPRDHTDQRLDWIVTEAESIGFT